ncbi:hypothetical protein GQ55_4G075100 [Panicum hallii var. hallii]|uniref:Uncharacterized protein n=1 Tax=Panicum hallii var. hallii TaxID=1504633 RepID=A0A2T7DW75_9POAL|nr:hypothetical protein GQ55_4G075100 [Panicum hallii var. hallii]
MNSQRSCSITPPRIDRRRESPVPPTRRPVTLLLPGRRELARPTTNRRPTMAAAPMRAWLLAALALALACALLSADAAGTPSPQTPAAAQAQAVSSGATKPKCEPGAVNDKACRVGAVHDPENQEEEGFSVTAKAPTGAPDTDSDDDYNDPDVPNDDQLVVVGH